MGKLSKNVNAVIDVEPDINNPDVGRELITKAELARRSGKTPQSVGKAVRYGRLFQIQVGEQYLIDFRADSTQRFMGDAKSNPKAQARYVKGLPKKRGPKTGLMKAAAGETPVTAAEAEELLLRKAIADTLKAEASAQQVELKNAQIRGELVSREAMNELVRYIDQLHSELERLADTKLMDIARDVLNEGALLPRHNVMWRDAVLSIINVTKNRWVDKLEEIAREQR